MANRIEITGVSDEFRKRIDDARGDVPLAAFCRRGVEKYVEAFEAPTSNPAALHAPTPKFKTTVAQTWARPRRS